MLTQQKSITPRIHLYTQAALILFTIYFLNTGVYILVDANFFLTFDICIHFYSVSHECLFQIGGSTLCISETLPLFWTSMSSAKPSPLFYWHKWPNMNKKQSEGSSLKRRFTPRLKVKTTFVRYTDRQTGHNNNSKSTT